MSQLKKCSNCSTENRPEAKFCKHCGQAMPVEDKFDGFFGKKNLEPLFDQFEGRAAVAAKLRLMGGKAKVGMDSLILGDAGTGKKFVADKLFEILQREKLTEEATPTVLDAADMNKWMEAFDTNINKISNGVLVITNAQKLVPGAYATSVGTLDKLFARMKSSSSSLPTVILCGIRKGMEKFLEGNPDIASLFEFRFDLSPMTEQDICDLCIDQLNEIFHISISDDAVSRLLKHLEWLNREGEGTYGNGHVADALAQELAVNAVSCGRTSVAPEDIKGQVFEPRTEAEIWKELEGFIGLENVKKEIHAIIDSIREAEQTGEKMKIEDHYVFTGNPGTGKTTIARIFADILGALGILPKGQFVEVAGKDLIADVVGGSERNVQDAVDKAMGGVLFIDEAYGLDQGEFGKAAIDKLLPIVENRRGEFVCILAGYSREMRDFMKANSGLESRFNKVIDFPDYDASELEKIFRIMAAKKGYALDAGADAGLHIEMEKMYNRRSENFGNARDVRNFLAAAEQRRRERIREGGDTFAAGTKTLVLTDIAGKDANEEVSVKDVMAELDALTGLDGVKASIRRLAASVNRELKLAQAEGRTPDVSVGHYLFLGNPGTGKTTVARLMGKMLHAMKLLPRPDVTEVLRDDLVAGYMGQTAQQTKEAVMDAMGGVLFIDEAYSLSSGSNDNFGQECINTLVPLLENYKGKFVCIAAGYSREMQDFLDANSGLKSRFRNRIDFEDYTPDQMLEIFEGMCRKQGLILPEESRKAVERKLQQIYDSRQWDFANAREVRNLMDDIKNNMAIRQFEEDCSDLQELKTIRPEDVI